MLTLIESFEEHLGANEDNLFSRKAWLSEIYRSRLGGSPETKTLADVASPEVRLKRQSALPEKERMEILKKMLMSMRWIANELQTSLASNGPATADANGTRRKR